MATIAIRDESEPQDIRVEVYMGANDLADWLFREEQASLETE